MRYILLACVLFLPCGSLAAADPAETPSEAVPRTDASYRSIAATRDQPVVGARR